MVGKENAAMSKEIKEEENFRKEGVESLGKEGIVRTRCYRRSSKIRAEKGSFILTMMRPLWIEAGIMSQRQKPDYREGRKKVGGDQAETQKVEKRWFSLERDGNGS